jgi:hypothetical protein
MIRGIHVPIVRHKRRGWEIKLKPDYIWMGLAVFACLAVGLVITSAPALRQLFPDVPYYVQRHIAGWFVGAFIVVTFVIKIYQLISALQRK